MEGLDCPAAAALAIIKTKQKNLFMLDLSIFKGFPETMAIGCRTAGEGVLLFYPVAMEIDRKSGPALHTCV